MHKHRLCAAIRTNVFRFDPPFSSFSYVDKHYGENVPAIRRLFSLARSNFARTVLIEDIPAVGIIADENDEIKEYFADHQMIHLQRISFWTSSFKVPDTDFCQSKNCIGYAILKCDRIPSRNWEKWHVFEAVFRKYPHEHNCISLPSNFVIMLGGIRTSLSGVLYAQQNELNKTCAQVGLRTLITRTHHEDVSYRQINEFAKQALPNNFHPANGLLVPQIRAVLDGFNIGFRDYDYTQHVDDERMNQPYQRYIYSGVESGAGAFVVFRFTGPKAVQDEMHLVPFFGHTFNQDTWAPDADIAYFRVGENFGFLSSQYWTSSFLGHDDNFGPNICVPRLYITPGQVQYVAELLRPRVSYIGSQAEAMAIQSLYSVMPKITITNNAWLKRLEDHVSSQRVVLRAVAVSREKYVSHLENNDDWGRHYENQRILDFLSIWLPNMLWVVEISIPQLFPANERKLGEIVLDGRLSVSPNPGNKTHFLLARLPGVYLIELRTKRHPQVQVPSRLVSHFPVIRQ